MSTSTQETTSIFGPPLKSLTKASMMVAMHIAKGRKVNRQGKVAWVTSGFPVEVLSALDFYTFYPENNPSDSTWMDVLFDIVSDGVESVSEENISLYPNPVSHVLTVDIPSSVNTDAARVEMYDVNGKLMLSDRLNEGQNRIELNSGIQSGTYIVRLIEGNRMLYRKSVQVLR